MGYQNLLRALKSEILGARLATMSKTLILVPGDVFNLLPRAAWGNKSIN